MPSVNNYWSSANLSTEQSIDSLIILYHFFGCDSLLKSRWRDFSPSALIPQYITTLNQVAFPVGSLHPPLFDISFPPSLNFGAMGAVLGHELTHAFDNDGHLYDGEGNLHQWWNEDTIEQFKERTECLISQYSNYSTLGKPINGTFTLGNIHVFNLLSLTFSN